MKKLLKKMKNEKVAEGRIIGLAGPCLFFFRLHCTIKLRYKGFSGTYMHCVLYSFLYTEITIETYIKIYIGALRDGIPFLPGPLERRFIIYIYISSLSFPRRCSI